MKPCMTSFFTRPGHSDTTLTPVPVSSTAMSAAILSSPALDMP
nr:hypothetical protein CPGR_00764 [Mycolicibacter nonchromogenicus]